MVSKRQKFVVIVVVALVIITGFVYLMLPAPETPSQVMILNQSDAGPGWQVTKPEKLTGQDQGASNSAEVRMRFNGSQIEGTCVLILYPTEELANASYDSGYKSLAVENPQRSGLLNITIGDRAVLVAYSSSYRENWSKQVIMQKGTSIVWMTLQSEYGPGIESDQILALAQIQAVKLP